MGMPAAVNTRGLIIVRSAPVSSSSCVLKPPLIFTSTMIRWPGLYLMSAVPLGLAAAAASFEGGGGAGRLR